MISYKNNEKNFLKKLKVDANELITPDPLHDFLVSIKLAIQDKSKVEFLWFSIPENRVIIYTGKIIDCYVSNSILSSTLPIIVFQVDVNGEDVIIQTPPIQSETVEDNNNNPNKFYFVDELMKKYAGSKLDPRLRVTVLC